MNWTQHELNLIDSHQDFIERKDLVGLLRAFSKEDEIGGGTSNAGLKIVFGILLVEPKIPFYLELDRGMVYLNLEPHDGTIGGAPYEGMATCPEVVEDIVMGYFKDPGFSPNSYKDLPIDELRALVKRAKTVMAGDK